MSVLAGLLVTPSGLFVAAFATAIVNAPASTDSSFAGSTTNEVIVIATIATAVNPAAARGVEGANFFMLPEHRAVGDPPARPESETRRRAGWRTRMAMVQRCRRTARCLRH